MLMRPRGLAPAFILGALLVAGGALTHAAQRFWRTETFLHDGVERTYALFAPDDLAEDEQRPLLLVLHGGGGDGRRMARYSDLHSVAADWFVVYPDGLANQWADGRALARAPWREPPDDVGFLAALIETLIAERPIDPDRVYVAGISNGGHMSLRLACDRADLLAGVAIVTANLPEALDCAPERPLRVIVMNGTDDPIVPYDGGHVAGDRGLVRSTYATFAFWAEANGCAGMSQADVIDTLPDDGTRAVISTYADCADETFVTLYRVEGGGHTWPGGRGSLPRRLVGETTQEFSASAVIYALFGGAPASITPAATPSAEASTLRDLLTDEACQIACYMGIEPGVTTRDEAANILQQAGIEVLDVEILEAAGSLRWRPLESHALLRGSHGLSLDYYHQNTQHFTADAHFETSLVIEAFGAPDEIHRQSGMFGDQYALIYRQLNLAFQTTSDGKRVTVLSVASRDSTDTKLSGIERVNVNCPTYGILPCIAATATPMP